MKILIYGAGVIGCTYGWQLAEVGHDVTLLVRKEQKQLIDEQGIHIICQDFSGYFYLVSGQRTTLAPGSDSDVLASVIVPVIVMPCAKTVPQHNTSIIKILKSLICFIIDKFKNI